MSLVIYVDVDDTLVRSFGTKRVPIDTTVRLVRELKQEGATLYCWSRGGAAYARSIADELALAECFEAFLPKPEVLLDDASLATWPLVELHPNEAASLTGAEVIAKRRR